jgi:HEAT repeat protein
VPNLDAIVAIAKDDSMPGGAADDAVKLLKVVGAPACIAPLVGMVGHPHANARFKYVAADSALKCGGVRAVKDVVHALPDGAYQQEELMGGVVVDITMMTPRPQVVAVLRELLADKSRIARWVAIEGLAALKSTEDIPRLQAVSSGEKLVGYWGDQSGVAPKDRKQDPTLGQRAKELAAAMGKAPK